jgi:glutamine---fructose-6-phosphate transaminase (isomerizing)
MQSLQSLMAQELQEAPLVLARQQVELAPKIADLARLLQKREPPIMVTCARGSSDHAASFAKTIFESRLGLLVASFAPSMSSVYETHFRSLENAIFIVISQSGKSPDIISSLIAANDAGALTIAIVNDETSPAAGLADVVLPMCAGKEYAVAATKSYVASLGALLHLLCEWQNDHELRTALARAPDDLHHACSLDWSQVRDELIDEKNLFVLGRSLTYGIAGEAALKLKETSSLHAEAYSAAEVKHGPMALIKKDFPVLMFAPDDKARTGFNDLSRDFSARGAKVFATGEFEGAINLPIVKNLHPLISPISQILSFYKMAEELAHLRGFNPDNPPFLQKVTQTR